MVELVFYDGIQMPANALRAKYCSKELTNSDAPADGNISQLTFLVDDDMSITFISVRRFTTGREIYKDKTYTERSTIKLVDKGEFFSIENLYKAPLWHDKNYSDEIHLPVGKIYLSSAALSKLITAINAEHQDVLIPRQKAAQEKRAKEKAEREAAAQKKAAEEKAAREKAEAEQKRAEAEQKKWIEQKRASCIELVFNDGLGMAQDALRARYDSKELSNPDGSPTFGDTSQLTFFIDSAMTIDFISERHFKISKETYRGKTYTEKASIQIIDREEFFTIANLHKFSSRYDGEHWAEIHLSSGKIRLSDGALTKLLETINNAHKDILITRQEAARKAMIAQRKENLDLAHQTISEWQAAWNEYPECYQKVIRFAQMEAVEILLNADYLARFESYLLSQWIKGSPYEKKAQGLLQTDSENLSVAHSLIQQFPVLVELVARECQWDDNYAACRIYGAFLHYIKSESVNQCEIIYGFTLQDKWSYEDCLKQYVQTAGTNSNDETRFSQFVYYMIVKNHVPIPDEENALPYHLGFEYAYHKIKEDISPYITEYLENAAIMKLDHLLSETQQSQSLTIEDFDLMSGVEFEQAISDLFKRMDYQVTTTPTTGDQGIDIIAVRGETRLGIQAKCYSGKVGNAAVQEVVAGVKYYNLNRCMVVTNSTFTASAIRLAKANNVVLWDRNILKEKIGIID